MASPTQFDVDLWSASGTRICEITHLVRNLYFIEERNEVETLQFSMDLDAFEDYMEQNVKADVLSSFREGQTEIKVRMGGRYLFGTQLELATIELNEDGSKTINVSAIGYLNFFKDRYPDPSIGYTDWESVEIFYDLVRRAQSVANGNYGIVIPTSGYYVTGKTRDRNYEYYTSSTKLNMQRLTNLVDGKFDFRILPDKTLMTYDRLGSDRSDFLINYDTAKKRSNLKRATLSRGANNLFNQIIGVGSGQGADQLISIKDDLPSQNEFKLRQKPVQFNEIKVQGTLDENAQAALDRYKKLLRMPQITLTGADLPVVPLEVGDRIPVRFAGRKLIQDMTGIYKIERREVTVDENHYISEMKLYFEKTGEYTG